jgi:two-component system chemotaxis sensor kinase CheA
MEFDRDTIVQMFLVEAEEHLAAMEESLLALESHPDDPELLGAVFRGAHTVKGNAGSLGFVDVADFAHGVEDLLARLRSGEVSVTAERVTLLLQCVDALRQRIPDAALGMDAARMRHQKLLERLAAHTEGRADTANAPAPERRLRPRRQREDLPDRVHTLRVDIGRLDRMLDLASEIAIARGRTSALLAGGGQRDVLESHRETDRLFFDLQQLILQARMVPLGPAFRPYARTVRDVAVAHGKQARLVIEGEDVEVDATVVNHLRDPLTHMIRNALDHGIETPAVRRGRGKDPCGTIRLRAVRQGGHIVIEVGDDGAGLDRQRVAERARRQGLIEDESRLGDQDVHRLVFESGFSTAEEVTDLSGRGLGLDVVRRNIQALRGSVSLTSEPGRGATFTIRLPLTLAIIDGFALRVEDETFVLPMDAVVECLELPAEEAARSLGRGVLNLRGSVLPYLCLRDHFGVVGPRPARQNVVVVRYDGGRAGLAVDDLSGEQQTVVKPLGALFRDVPGIAGSAILGTGRVALILDVPVLLREAITASATEPSFAP